MISGGTPTPANRALAAIKKLMSWCVDRGVLEVSPIAGLQAPAKEVARVRVLSDVEIVACWNAGAAESFPFAEFVQILILTGQRRGEVAGMCWSEIDFAKGTWTIPAQRQERQFVYRPTCSCGDRHPESCSEVPELRPCVHHDRHHRNIGLRASQTSA